MSTYEHTFIHGIPYYKNKSGEGNIVYTFDQRNTPIAIGTHDIATDTLTFYDNWRERITDNLTKFRASINPQERDKLRETITKPTKQRKSARNPRKSTRTKDSKN